VILAYFGTPNRFAAKDEYKGTLPRRD